MMGITDRDISQHSVADEMDAIEADELGISDETRLKRKRVMDQRSGADLKKKWEQGDRAALDAREKAQAPPDISVPQCNVCQSKHREWIESAIVQGAAYARIAGKLEDKGEKIDRRSIAGHYQKGHMNLQREAIRAELEEEAKALQQNVEDGALGARTDRGILRVLVTKGFDDVIKGVSSVEPKDMVQIIKLLNELNSTAEDTRAQENEIALRTFVRAIESVCPQEMIIKIVAEAERLRDLDDVTFEMEGIIVKSPGATPPLELESKN